MKSKSLQDLKQMRLALAAAAEREARALQARQQAEARARAERAAFAQAVGPVQALRGGLDRVQHARQPPQPLPVQRLLDEQAVLRESLSDEFDVTTLLDVDDAMSFRRPGVGTDVTRKLRAGHWSIQAQLDLHGLRRDEARETLGNFVREAHRQGVRCVRVVHGKGLGSPGKTPVLKAKVQGWLIQKSEVLAFVQARASEGGAGALVVLLQPLTNRQPAG
ncbi:MAG: Smr/MutS family protein [Comamonas sp.]